jgi:hypothetical protein
LSGRHSGHTRCTTPPAGDAYERRFEGIGACSLTMQATVQRYAANAAAECPAAGRRSVESRTRIHASASIRAGPKPAARMPALSGKMAVHGVRWVVRPWTKGLPVEPSFLRCDSMGRRCPGGRMRALSNHLLSRGSWSRFTSGFWRSSLLTERQPTGSTDLMKVTIFAE